MQLDLRIKSDPLVEKERSARSGDGEHNRQSFVNVSDTFAVWGEAGLVWMGVSEVNWVIKV